MNAKFAGIAMLGVALLVASPQAFAHKKHHRGHVVHHDGYAYGDRYYDERHRLPRWLRRHDGFRAWYRHTPLRHNLRLGWDDLYSIFIWERRYSNHRRFHHYGNKIHRDYGYYRKYWKKHSRDRGHRRDRAYRDDRGHHRRDRERRRYRD